MTPEETAVFRNLHVEVSALRGLMAWMLSALATANPEMLSELQIRLVDGMRGVADDLDPTDPQTPQHAEHIELTARVVQDYIDSAKASVDIMRGLTRGH